MQFLLACRPIGHWKQGNDDRPCREPCLSPRSRESCGCRLQVQLQHSEDLCRAAASRRALSMTGMDLLRLHRCRRDTCMTSKARCTAHENRAAWDELPI